MIRCERDHKAIVESRESPLQFKDQPLTLKNRSLIFIEATDAEANQTCTYLIKERLPEKTPCWVISADEEMTESRGC